MRTVEQTLIEAGRYYTIASAVTGNVIEYVGKSESGAELQLGKYEHKPEQEWSFDRVGENSYRIHCRANNKVVDLMMAGTDNGTWLHLWDDVLGSSQMWTLVPGNDGTVRIVSPWASGKCVDTVGMGSPVGAVLQIWQETQGGDQLWTIHAVKDKKPAEEAQPAVEAAPAEVKAQPAAEAAPAEVKAEPAVEAAPAEVKAEPAAEAAPAEAKAEPAAEAAPTEAKAEPAAEAAPAEAKPAPKKRTTRKK